MSLRERINYELGVDLKRSDYVKAILGGIVAGVTFLILINLFGVWLHLPYAS